MPVTFPTPALKFTMPQLREPGPRSANIRFVPSASYPSLQAAINVSDPGDTIVTDPTYVSGGIALRMEKNMNTTTCPKRGDGTPADILIVCNDARFWNPAGGGAFVLPTTRMLFNKDYPSGLEVLRVSNRLTWPEKGTITKIQASGPNVRTIDFFPSNQSLPGDLPAYYRFVGLHLAQWATLQTSGGGVFLSFAPDNSVDTPRGTSLPGTYGYPHHIVFDRCIFESDPNNVGWASCQVAIYNWCGKYVALINCDFRNFYGGGSGDPKLLSWGGIGDGPYHIENCHLNGMNILFTGGTGLAAVDAGLNFKNFVLRRNHAHRPEWLQPSEDGRPNLVCNIAADKRSVTLTSKPWGDGFRGGSDGFQIATEGGLLVDPATGVCRRFLKGRNGDIDHQTLDADWPTAPVNNLTVHIMYSNWIVASSLTGGTATTTAGSTHVTTSQDIPPEVIAENDLTLAQRRQDIRAHCFFKTASLPGWAVSGFGQFSTLPEHIKILSIDPDRRGMTLASAPSVVGTHPYFVVAWDGLYRPGQPANAGKAFGEYKMAEICEHEGNIVDNNAELWRFHPTSQGTDHYTMTATISGDTVTLPAGGIPSFASWWIGVGNLPEGPPVNDGPFVVIWRSAWWTGQGSGRVKLASLTSGTLEAGHTLASGTYGIEITLMQAPQSRNADMLFRYNIFKRFATGFSIFPATNIWETRKTEKFWFTDNLQMDYGARIVGSDGSSEVWCHPVCQGTPDNSWGVGQRAVRGATTRDALDHIKYSHNTSVRCRINDINGYAMTIGNDVVPTPAAMLGVDWEVNDNIAHNTGPAYKALMGQYVLSGSVGSALDPLTRIVTPAIARNIFGGAGATAAKALAQFSTNFSDNATIDNNSGIGLTDPAATIQSPLTAYQLVDIHTAACTIASDGLSATFGAALPATVAVGQFFRTAATATLVRILSIAGTTIRWSTGTTPVYPVTGAQTGIITFKGSASDGLDPGADIPALIDFTAGVDTLEEPGAVNQPPTCTIQTPTAAATYATNQSPLALAGVAADDLAVTSVTWANSAGGSGIASGSTTWGIASVTLTAGVNVITVTAHDIGGLTGYDDLTVTYTPPPASNIATLLPIATVTPVATVAPARVP